MILKPDDLFRPKIHFSTPANWLNDPNGLVYDRGEYHLFYQHHPHSPDWGPTHWGHAVSPDLLNWQHLPVALYPDEYGAIYSGSAVVDGQNTAGFGAGALVAIFTHHQDGFECQSLAYSCDGGRTWRKYPGNPVLLPPTGLVDFRDPKVFWYAGDEQGCWIMALAAGQAIRFYRSPDLIHWQAGGSFGDVYGSQQGVWETPDLFQLPVDGGPATRWVLTVGVGAGAPGGGSGVQYFVGQFDGATFQPENPPGYPPDNPLQTILWADFGADYYAPQSWNEAPGGRRLMIGWLNNWGYARSLPLGAWNGAFSLPRELTLRSTPDGVRLFQQPLAELAALRGLPSRWRNLTLQPGITSLAHPGGGCLELCAEFRVNPAAGGFGLRVRVGEHEQTTIGYDFQAQQVYLDRSQSGLSDFAPGFASRHTAAMPPRAGVVSLRIVLDRCSVEVFGNDGQVVLSDLIFPGEHSLGLEVFSAGADVLLKGLDLYELAPARFIMPDRPGDSSLIEGQSA